MFSDGYGSAGDRLTFTPCTPGTPGGPGGPVTFCTTIRGERGDERETMINAGANHKNTLHYLYLVVLGVLEVRKALAGPMVLFQA